MKVVFYISAGKIIYGSLEPLYCRQSGYTHTHTISRFIPFVYTRSFIIMDRISIFRTGRPIIKKKSTHQMENFKRQNPPSKRGT